MTEHDPKVAAVEGNIDPESLAMREIVVSLKPRFDVKVTLTTRGWTWEIELKDCPDGTLAQHLADQARAVIATQMKDILAEGKEGQPQKEVPF